MPIYEYHCDDCDRVSSSITTSWRDRRDSIPCPECGKPCRFIISVPGAIYPPYPEYDGGNVWKGTALEGIDGRNPATHESETPFVDLGNRVIR